MTTFLLIAGLVLLACTFLLGVRNERRKRLTEHFDRLDQIQRSVGWDKVFHNLGIDYTHRGKNYIVSICPHCREENVVYASPLKGIYKCFRCGESGSMIGFVMKVKGITYNEAVDLLESWM